MEELIKRLERVIQTGTPDKDGMHPISAETVLEEVNELSEHGTNLASLGTDLISRQAAIERFDYIRPRDPMTSDYTHGIDVGIALCKVAIREQPLAQLSTNLAEVGTDLISKEQAIDALEDAEDAFGYLTRDWREVLMELPPIQPKRGRWLKLDMHIGMADHKCTACEQECYVPTCMGEPMYAYCPNCGAKMEVTTPPECEGDCGWCKPTVIEKCKGVTT